ncbi:MAG: RagB/SusD family nutrient uptake outer membrane protein [Flavobacteriales bacterium]|nr:RagB/SusD family nutrient uptake outer membrane protein [Flavobacteriales bacterium]
MKNIYRNLTIAAGCTLLLAACSKDRLVVDPVNEFLSSNYYQTEDQVASALIGVYDPIGWSMAYGQWISPTMMGEIRSDNANAGGDPSNNDQPGWQELDDFTNTNSNVVLHPIYRKGYIGISRANALLDLTEIESEAVSSYKAQAQWLRAYYHFELFRHFGPIPVVNQSLTPEDMNLERGTLSEVMQQIVSDCQEALPYLPLVAPSGQEGRITQGAAYALMGKAYLYWADLKGDDPALFQSAADAFQSIVDLGAYQLQDDMQELFVFENRNTSESVFEIQHNPLWSSDWGWFEGVDGNGMIQLCGVRGLCAEHPDYEAGWGFMSVTEGLWNHFLDDDTFRRDVAILSEDELAQQLADAGVSCDPIIDMTQNNPVDFTGYWQEKYPNLKAFAGLNVNGGNEHLTKAQNTHVFRYADVLLMLAEALHRGSGDDGTAQMYIDIVRERAAGPGDNTGNFRSAATVMADEGWSLLDLIWYERRAELACEGDRWYDLVRSGRADASLFAGDGDKEANFGPDDLWLPIALEETQIAAGLTTYPDESLFN